MTVFGKKLNPKEAMRGAIFGACFFWFIGLWALITAPVSAFLWAIGGSGLGRFCRFVGCTAAVTVALLLKSEVLVVEKLLLGSALAAGIVLTQGYGIPSTQPFDEGSPLGRFFFNTLKLQEKPASVATQGTLAFFLGLSFCPLFKVSPAAYIISVVLLVAGIVAVELS